MGGRWWGGGREGLCWKKGVRTDHMTACTSIHMGLSCGIPRPVQSGRESEHAMLLNPSWRLEDDPACNNTCKYHVTPE